MTSAAPVVLDVSIEHAATIIDLNHVASKIQFVNGSRTSANNGANLRQVLDKLSTCILRRKSKVDGDVKRLPIVVRTKVLNNKSIIRNVSKNEDFKEVRILLHFLWRFTVQDDRSSQWTVPMGRKSHCVVGTSSIAFAIVDMRESESNCEIGMAFMKEEVLGSDL
jgi:hypothetical protein